MMRDRSPRPLPRVIVMMTGLACAGQMVAAETLFQKTTASAGVEASHSAVENFWVTGQAWGDIDRDGAPDLYLTDSQGSNHLYLNTGTGSFVESPLSSQVALPDAMSGGATFADFDNDGWTDLYVLANGPNALFRNLEGNGFEEVAAAAGVADRGKGESAVWGDFDRDGDLDLYVVNWYFGLDPDSELVRDGLYRNQGDGTFTDVSGLLDETTLRRPGFAAGFADLDNDGDQDLYVVNDKYKGNVLWRNDGAGCGGWCFTDVSLETGAHRPVEGMGLAISDYDRDGDLDLYFSSSNEMVLLQNQAAQGGLAFLDVSEAAGVSLDAIGWGSVFFDYNRDGWPDIYLATMNPQPERSNRLFENLGDGTFADRTEASGMADVGPSIGVAKSDYDRDGWQDVVVGNWGEGYELYRNMGIAGAGSHWLEVGLVGGGPVARQPVGTRVVAVTVGGRRLMEELTTESSLGAGNEMSLFFGLGDDLPERLEIYWPDGTVAQVDAVPVDQRWTLVYPSFVISVFADGFESGDTSAWFRTVP